MNKGLLFLSAAITTFALAILVFVAVQAKANRAASLPTNTVVLTNTVVPTDTATLPPTDMPSAQPSPTSAVLSPLEAAFIAASAIGNNKIYSVDTVTRYGLDVYQVSFSSGAIVYVSPEGHVLLITSLQSNVAPTSDVQQGGSQSSSAKKKSKPQATSAPSQHSGAGEGSGGDD